MEAAQPYCVNQGVHPSLGSYKIWSKEAFLYISKGVREKPPWNWRAGLSSAARKSPTPSKSTFFFSRDQVVTFCPVCSVGSVSAHQCQCHLTPFSAFPLYVLVLPPLYCPFNSAHSGPTLGSFSTGGYWPVRKTKTCLAFLNLFFELLHTVQESHHCMVKLVVPEKPQPPRTVQWQLLPEKRELAIAVALTQVTGDCSQSYRSLKSCYVCISLATVTLGK